MIETAEQRGFVWAITFILVYSALLASVPVGLQGQGATPTSIAPVSPTLLAGFSDTETFLRDNFTAGVYEYDLGGRSWFWQHDDVSFLVGAKVLVFGIFWFGGLDIIEFHNGETNRGSQLTLAEITEDAEDGTATYTMQFTAVDSTGGTAIFYYNTTAYDNATIAWVNDGLYVLHGVGFDSSAGADAGSLLISLLTLSVPDVPELVQVLLLSPVFASVVYLIWFIVKETLPFV